MEKRGLYPAEPKAMGRPATIVGVIFLPQRKEYTPSYTLYVHFILVGIFNRGKSPLL
jgi:hypothetical protein